MVRVNRSGALTEVGAKLVGWPTSTLSGIGSGRCAGPTFTTSTGLPFTYRLPGDFLRVSRDGREINRSLSRTNFAKAAAAMPVARPSDINGSRGRRTPGRFSWTSGSDKATGKQRLAADSDVCARVRAG